MDRLKAGDRRPLLTDLLDKNMSKDAGKPEQQSGTSAKRWSEIEKQNFPFPFVFFLPA